MLSCQKWFNSWSVMCFSVMSNVPFQWKTHNSVEQKFVVKTPSCATNVSDHSSMYGLVVVFVSSVLRLDFLLESELFFRLNCALAPTFKTTFCTIPNESRSVSSLSFAVVEFNKQTGEVDEVEDLGLYCGMVNQHFGDRLVFLCELMNS